MSATLDQILPPAAPLAHPLTGEVIDRDDLAAIKAALADAEEEQRTRGPFYRARAELQVRLAELDPVELPRRSSQTEKQSRLERCPRCRTPLPRTVIAETSSEGEEREPDVADALAASPSESSTLDEGGPEAGGAPDDSAGTESPPSSKVATASAGPTLADQATLLPRGPRTAEQEAALGIDILGESLATSPPATPGVEVDDQPSSTTPEPEEAEAATSEDTSSGSTPLFEIPASARSEP